MGRCFFPNRPLIAVLDDIVLMYLYSNYPRIDKGAGMASKAMQRWSEERDFGLLLTQPGKATQNAYVESFNSRVRVEQVN